MRRLEKRKTVGARGSPGVQTTDVASVGGSLKNLKGPDCRRRKTIEPEAEPKKPLWTGSVPRAGAGGYEKDLKNAERRARGEVWGYPYSFRFPVNFHGQGRAVGPM